MSKALKVATRKNLERYSRFFHIVGAYESPDLDFVYIYAIVFP